MDPTRIYPFVASINNTSITDKTAKQVRDAPRMQKDIFQRGSDIGSWLTVSLMCIFERTFSSKAGLHKYARAVQS